MRKTTLIATAVAAAGLGILVANTASAQSQMEFLGNVGGECSFGPPTDGTLNITGDAFATGNPGSITVTNNESGFYKINSTGPVLTTKPAGMSVLTEPTLNGVWTGPNSSNGNPDGNNLSLANAGTDSFSLSFTGGKFNQTALAGDYTMRQTFNCVPK